MKEIYTLSICAVCALAGGALAGPSNTVECYRIAEIDLLSSQTYDNPYKDVEISAVFTGPKGQQITRPAFWYKDQTWKLRFAPTCVGEWAWTTTCSDPKDNGLHKRTGVVSCVAYKGDLPIFKHGFLRVSQTKRYLTFADGTPFFWLGDTHWQGPDREAITSCNHPVHKDKPCPHGGQFQHLMQDRKTKGFTVYQLYPNVGNESWWKVKYDRVNPDRFLEEFDAMMDYSAAQGFVVAMGLGHWSAPKTIKEDDLKRWARYIVARYGAHPVVWITAQEADMEKKVLKLWLAVAKEIHQTDGYGHPLSYHQHQGVIMTWWKEDWHDWGCTQGGHRNCKLRTKNDYRRFWDYTPHKPWLESESNYEAMKACSGPHSAAEVRHAAWKSMLCGSFGYTYGSSGVWLPGRNAKDLKSPWIDHVWYDGMVLPGSTQMGHLKRFFTALEWWTLAPRWNDPEAGVWQHPEESVLSSIEDRIFVVYFYHQDKATGVLKRMDPQRVYSASWFDPRKGEYTKIADDIRADKGQWNIPSKSDADDWVLLVKSK